MLAELIAIRHGQSVANVAVPAADAAGRDDAGLTGGDAAVALTDLGRDQSLRLGRWLAANLEPPDVVLSSPYRRARDTAALILPGASVQIDDRLRDRVQGRWELLTETGIRRRFPAEARRRDEVGDFHYRPPGGESMVDVADRTRDLLHDLPAGRRIVVVGHDATVLVLRYVLDGLDPDEVLRLGPIHNASVTRWVAGRLDWFNRPLWSP
jgi:probable phosphoglycerate mutase